MFNFSFYELLILAIIALVVLGPEKLPKAVRTVGTYYAKFTRTVGTLKAEMEAELDLVETRRQLQKEMAELKQAEADMQKQMDQLRGNLEQFGQQNTALPETQVDTQKVDKHEPNQTLIQPDAHASIKKPDEANLNSDHDEDLSSNTLNKMVIRTEPWKNMWFLLGSYDKVRRLPPAPLMPNYKADPLLNQQHNVNNDANTIANTSNIDGGGIS